MLRTTRKKLKTLVPPSLISQLAKYQALSYVLREFNGRHPRHCPICDYNGKFFGYGVPFQYDCICPRCRSAERHRQHHLLVQRHPQWIDGARILHFAAESCFVEDYKARASHYVQADYMAGPDEVKVDIRQMQFDDGAFDTIVCHQIMEHVDHETAALSELFRVVRPGGIVLLSTPIIETWETSYENATANSNWTRDLHFGQNDHVRYYGRNFRDLVRQAGFDITEDIAREPDVARHSLRRGEVIFIASKPDAARQS